MLDGLIRLEDLQARLQRQREQEKKVRREQEKREKEMNEMNEEEMKEVETATRFLLRNGDMSYRSLDNMAVFLEDESQIPFTHVKIYFCCKS